MARDDPPSYHPLPSPFLPSLALTPFLPSLALTPFLPSLAGAAHARDAGDLELAARLVLKRAARVGHARMCIDVAGII